MKRLIGGLLLLSLAFQGRAQDENDPGREAFDGARPRPASRVEAPRGSRASGLARSSPASGRPAEPAKAGEPTGAERMRADIAYLSSAALGGRSPMSEGSRLAREYIIRRFAAAGLKPGAPDGTFVEPVTRRVLGTRIGGNVVAFIEGAKTPDECVYVEAHYDHWGKAGGKSGPGANDNASGVAVMLELAGAVAALKPDRTVVFLAGDYEEGALMPMLGGLKGAAAHMRAPFCAPDKIKGAVVMDMMGGKFIAGLDGRLFLLGSESSARTYALAGRVSAADAVERFGVYAIEPLGARVPRGDYAAFRDRKVPFIFATSGIPSFYHTPGDTIDKIDFVFMERAAKTVLELVRAMAASDFAGEHAQDPDAVVDWPVEKATALRLLADVSAGRAGDELRKLAVLDVRLRAAVTPGEIKSGLKDLTMLLMKMNGALKTWQHVYRTH